MTENSRSWLIPAALGGLVLLGVGYWLLNRPYGETSEAGYQYAIALFSACGRKDSAGLEKISQMIESATEEGELQPNEAKWLTTIVDKGLAGQWEAASRDVRQLMEDQVTRATLPNVES